MKYIETYYKAATINEDMIQRAKFDIEQRIRENLLLDVLGQIYKMHGYNVKVVLGWQEIKHKEEESLYWLDKDMYKKSHKEIILRAAVCKDE